MASGYIAGGAIAGIVIAFMAGVPCWRSSTTRWTSWSKATIRSSAERRADLLSLIPFADPARAAVPGGTRDDPRAEASRRRNGYQRSKRRRSAGDHVAAMRRALQRGIKRDIHIHVSVAAFTPATIRTLWWRSISGRCVDGHVMNR